MRVSFDAHDGRVLAHPCLPGLCPAHVEALLARQTVDHRSPAACKTYAICAKRHREAGIVRNVLAERQGTVDAIARNGFVGAVLACECRRPGSEPLMILLREPVAKVSLGVKLAALIVKTVADLVSDDDTDAAIVDGIVRAWIKEGRLQYRRRKHNFILLRIVIGVDGLRIHLPFIAIDRPPELGKRVLIVKHCGTLYVADEIVVLDAQRRIVAPALRVADLGDELGDLGLRLLFGRLSYPVKSGNTRLIGGKQIVDEREHARLALGRKMLLNVQPSEALAE